MKNHISILTLLIAITFFSCKEKVDFELNEDENSRLVVEASVTDQTKAHIVKLTRTSSYYESQPAPKETGATVSLYDGVTYHNLTETTAGIYSTSSTYKGVVGRTYTLSITTQGGKDYTTTSVLNSVAVIDTVLYDIKSSDDADDVLVLSHYGPEPSGVGDNYLWLVYINGINFTDNIAFVTDDFVDGNYINGFEFQEIDLADLSNADTLKVSIEMHSISRDYFDFLSAILSETSSNGDLFSGPPANIPSNINNGALGFFRASAVSTEYIEIVLP